MSEQKDSIPLSGEPDKERKQQNPLPPGKEPERPDLLATIYKPHVRGDKFSWWDIVHSKRAWTFFIFLLFASYFCTAIPVEKVPLLRNLAYLMGYTREETKTFSFLKTLVTLPQRYKEHRAAKEDWERIRKSSAAAMAASTEDALFYKAQLINFKQSIKGSNPQGQDSDELQKIRQANTARDSRVVAMASVKRDDPAAAQTTQKIAGSEVFFGAQQGITPRDPTAGFDTTQALSKLPSPGIVDSHKTDKLLEAAESFYSRTTNIDFQNKLVEHTVGSRTMMQDLSSPDDKKPRVDVVYAWLTSRAAKRTENKMLKKTLAAAGFLGADLTRPMLLTALDGTGTVAVDPRQIDIDISVAKERTEREEKCTNYLVDGAYQHNIGDRWKSVNNRINSMWDENISKLPSATCNTYEGLITSFNDSMTELKIECNDLDSSYSEVEKACQIKVQEGSCENLGLTAEITSLKNSIYSWCQPREEECNENCSSASSTAPCMVDGKQYTSMSECRTKYVNSTKVKDMTVSLPNYFSETDQKAEFVKKLKEGEGGRPFFTGVDTGNIQNVFSDRVGLDWETNQN